MHKRHISNTIPHKSITREKLKKISLNLIIIIVFILLTESLINYKTLCVDKINNICPLNYSYLKFSNNDTILQNVQYKFCLLQNQDPALQTIINCINVTQTENNMRNNTILWIKLSSSIGWILIIGTTSLLLTYKTNNSKVRTLIKFLMIILVIICLQFMFNRLIKSNTINSVSYYLNNCMIASLNYFQKLLILINILLVMYTCYKLNDYTSIFVLVFQYEHLITL